MDLSTLTIRSNNPNTAPRVIPSRLVVGLLAIHRPAFDAESPKSRWHITHGASGLRLATVRSLPTAKTLAQQLMACGDWTWTEKADCPNELKVAAFAIVKDYQ